MQSTKSTMNTKDTTDNLKTFSESKFGKMPITGNGKSQINAMKRRSAKSGC